MTTPDSALAHFHSATQTWFRSQVGTPSAVQAAGWPAINGGGHVLMAAPTGSGKTLAALLHAIDALVVASLHGPLPDQVHVLYVSPLKALSTDVHHNLQAPLAGIAQALQAEGRTGSEVRVACRTGDTPQAERQRILKKPPHVLVTTPESLYLLLGAASGHKLLRHVKTLIVDEVHALANNRRGSHLSLSIEHLCDIAAGPVQRIGLSATQKPMDEVARFLVGTSNIDGAGRPRCTLIDTTRASLVDVALSLPASPLEAIMSNEVWGQVYDQMVALIEAHKTTLVFVNTRRMAERLAYTLAERLGEHSVVAHHGSLAASVRKTAEDRLKRGDLRALVATGSLELGIDMGEIDLVCQVGSLRSIGTFIQRIGRANHRQGGVPKGRLFPLTRDELVECTALLRCLRSGELDTLEIPKQPLDILAQQLVARVSALGDVTTQVSTLRAWVRRAYPYRDVDDTTFDEVLAMVANGYATRRGRRGTLLHLDGVNQEVRPRKGAQLAALTCGGAIADTGDFKVMLMPQELTVGQVTEEFAVDSQVGDVFVLGTMHWRILGVKAGSVLVQDAQNCPPSIPSWAGEAPSRSPELSAQVSQLRRDVAAHLHSPDAIIDHLCGDPALPRAAMQQMVTYLHATQHALGIIPNDQCLVAERFFDSAGGMQMVLHCPLGSRVNRAFGLALRKRFCKSFNFELQAAATEDAIVLSLGEVHSFVLADVFRFLNAKTVRNVLIQALLDAPMFQTRWRWNAGRSLAVLRMWGGKKVAPQVLRMQAEDLVAAVFPDQIACAENIQGERQVPQHPLVQQTIDDCLHEAMDIDALVDLLERLADKRLPFMAVDTPEPSPACHEILVARPYAFLDDGEAEERRTHAVYLRRDLRRADEPGAQGQISQGALTQVVKEAWPKARNADEVHDALMTMVLGPWGLIMGRSPEWLPWLEHLVAQGRVQRVTLGSGTEALACTEHVNVWAALVPEPRAAAHLATLGPLALQAAQCLPVLAADAALARAVGGLLQVLGPTTAAELAAELDLDAADIDMALMALEREGRALRGAFRTLALRADIRPEWCDRRLLARLHRYTVRARRSEVRPVSQATYQQFLWQRQGLDGSMPLVGTQGLRQVLAQLGGLELPAKAWEADVLPARMAAYASADLDALCVTGEVGWGRISQPTSEAQPRKPLASSPMAVVAREDAWAFRKPLPEGACALSPKGCHAGVVLGLLQAKGALFTLEIGRQAGLTGPEVAQALSELAALGLVSSDSFAGLRALLEVGRTAAPGRRRLLAQPRAPAQAIDRAGRWSLSAATEPVATHPKGAVAQQEQACKIRIRALLARWGVVSQPLLRKENNTGAWPQMVRLLRQMEMRGEVLGGYFIEGINGEQFADAASVKLLGGLRDGTKPRTLGVVSAADPINLTGILGGAKRVPRVRKHRLICRDGVPIAAWIKDQLHRLQDDAATDFELLHCLAQSNTLRAVGHRPALAQAGSSAWARAPQTPEHG